MPCSWMRSKTRTAARNSNNSLAAPGSFPCAALNEDQPVDNDRFYREFEAMTGERRELRKWGRPRKLDEPPSPHGVGQGKLPFNSLSPLSSCPRLFPGPDLTDKGEPVHRGDDSGIGAPANEGRQQIGSF